MVGIKDNLFPMSTLIIRGGCELYFIRDFIKVNIKPRDDTMNSVISKEGKFIVRSKVQVFFFNSVEIDFHNFASRGVDSAFLTDVNEGFRHNSRLYNSHIYVVNVFPEREFVILVVTVF
jgi:hypothetical protein